MNYLTAIEELSLIVPNICTEIYNEKNVRSYSVISIFTSKIKEQIILGNTPLFIKYIQKMNEIYAKGDLILKYALENVFVYSLDQNMMHCGLTQRQVVIETLSDGLKNAYSRQIYNHQI